jgi:serine phosphatase RsbU (regulator of sigma subunit)/anti-sigma regulatory factor (Ser/Thr protein kinase)
MARRSDTRVPKRARFEDALGSGTFVFRRRLSIGAVVAILVLVGVASTLAWNQYTDGRQRALNDAHARVVLAASLLDAYFGGEISVLSTVAQAPAVVAQDKAGMSTYFHRVQPPGGTLFNGGIGWIDLHGFSQVSSNTPVPKQGLNVSDRDYFKAVIATGKPFVSEGLIARTSHKQIIVMAVPTRDAQGHLTGVLAGSLLTKPKGGTSKASLDLGFAGLAILDRKNHLVLADLGHPKNAALLAQMSKLSVGTLSNAQGLNGASGHVVAFATATIPDWRIVIDRPRSAVFAAAMRGLILELISIAAAALFILGLLSWIMIRARREAEEEHERMRQWNELTRTLGGASAAQDVSEALVAALSIAFPEASTLVALEVDGRLGLMVSGAPEGASSPKFNANEVVLVQVAKLAYEARDVVAIEDEASLLDQQPRLHGALGVRVRSLYAVPLIARGGRCIGALSLLFAEERALNENERALVAAQAEQAAQALVRAERYEREHEVAIRLQRSLLSEKLPQADGIDVAGRYQAGAVGLEVGGDWYDVIRRPDGIIHFTVGDVAGRGLAAAALMGQLRNAFRAYAYDHTSPAEIVRRLTRHVADDEMATTVCLTLDPYTCELAYASAGHPPTLLLDGESKVVSRLDDVSSPPLGYAQAVAVRETRLLLPAGATLAAYTDGLVERRGSSIETGIELLESTIRASSWLDASGLADAVLTEIVTRRGADDDIALLVLRLLEVPARMEIEIPAHPSALSGLRRRLRAWLTLRGLDEDERADTVLAICEACNNAVEHAYEQNEGTIRLLLEHDAERLQIVVADSGSWRERRPSPERGRGTPIMKSLMDNAEIEHDQRGTRVTLERRLNRT